MGGKINKINALILLAIFITLDISYKHSIIEVYGYMGFKISNTYIGKDIFAYTIAAVVIYIINFKLISNFAKIIIQLIAIILLFPAIIMFKNSNSDYQILIAHLLFFFSVYIALKYFKFRIASKTLNPKQKLSFLIILTILFVIPFFLTYKTNINLRNFLLEDIYETRAIQSKLSNAYLGYMYSWLGRVIVPIALISSIMSGARSKSTLLIIILLYLFLIGAHKSLLLGTVLLIIFYYIPKRYISLSISLGTLFTLILAELLFNLYHNYMITGLITRRVFFVPALLDTFYFDFFRGKPLFWSYSFLNSLIDYPYQSKPTNLIAYTYLGSREMSSNNGIISDGYSNLGWIGIIFNIFIVSGMFSFFNSLRISHRYIGLFIYFLTVIVSSTLPTILLTHGGILLIFMSQFILKDTEDSIN